MSWRTRLLARTPLRLLRRRRDERDLADEILFDLEEEARQRIERGEPAEAARASARHDFGSVARVEEETREAWGWTALESFGRDFRIACRFLAKSPGFSIVAILTLGLGIGANTAIFSVVNTLLIEPLPFRDADRLVSLNTILERYDTDQGAVAYPDILEWKAKTGLFEAVAAWNPQSFDITSGSAPERVSGIVVDREYFRVMTDPQELLRPVQSAIWGQDPKLAISDAKTMREVVEADLARPRFSAFLLGAFAATALLMSAIGIYGLVSYVVAQQTKEIGIRMALGALRGDILRTVTGRALTLAGAGVAAGLAGALAVARLMETMLYGVSATDAGAFLAASGLLIATAAVASYIPARRASRADPLAALRYE